MISQLKVKTNSVDNKFYAIKRKIKQLYGIFHTIDKYIAEYLYGVKYQFSDLIYDIDCKKMLMVVNGYGDLGVSILGEEFIMEAKKNEIKNQIKDLQEQLKKLEATDAEKALYDLGFEKHPEDKFLYITDKLEIEFRSDEVILTDYTGDCIYLSYEIVDAILLRGKELQND